MTIYRPYSQIVEHDMYLMVRARSAADASRLAIELGSLLQTVDRSREWADVRLMQDVIKDSESVRLRRFVVILFAIFYANWAFGWITADDLDFYHRICSSC